ncbi:MAG: hypothetical protein U0586_13450 [Candidatus Brocadiaceae bacterium]
MSNVFESLLLPSHCPNYIAQLRRNQFSCESGKIASEKTLAMTLAMHFNGARHLVIASGAQAIFPS